MPTLPMLDVAIGMTFLFLLISLICTALNEILEALLKNRATDLERGIREMLGGQTQEGTAQVSVKKLYEHPLIYSLFQGKYREKAAFRLRSLPSYIPARTFALALMDIVLPASGSAKSGATDTTTRQPDPAPADGNNATTAQGGDSGGADSGSTPPVTPPANAAPADIVSLRVAVTNMPNDHLRRALLPLIDAAGGDLTVARENIENWYNSTMDRVAGWYKRRAQVIILLLGFLVAWSLNADAVAVCKSLLNDPALRNSVAAAAANYKPATPDNAKNQLDATLTQLEALKLPIGWDWANTDAPAQGLSNSGLSNKELACPTIKKGEAWWQTPSWWLKILGWFITGVAVSLGAPFWFDVLNKFMIVRSTVKPHEKSPEESSEDRQ